METEITVKIDTLHGEATISEGDKKEAFSIVTINNTGISHTVADALETYLMRNPRPINP